MKINTNTRLHKIGIAFVIALAAGFSAFGQKAGNLAKMQRENAESLSQYTWKSRTEIKKGGETKVVRLDQVRYAIDGSLQQTQLSVQAPEPPTGGLRGLIAKKKKAQFTELIEGLSTLAKSYGKIPSEKMEVYITHASISPEKTAQQNLFRINGTDVLQAGDSMTIWVDGASHKRRKVEVRSSYDGKAVRIVSEFKDLPDGTNHLARAVIEFPNEELVVTTDNYDHVREQREVASKLQ